MNKTLTSLALAAGLLTATAAAASAAPTYTTPEDCTAAGFIWAGDFCYDRVASNPTTPAPTPSAAPTPEPQPTEAPVPAPEVPTQAPEVLPAPVPAPVPAPAPYVPAPAPVVQAPTELAYTGAEDIGLATAGLVIGLSGVALLRWNLRRQRDN